MNLFIIGTGLIGGSMALGLKSRRKDLVVFGIDSDDNHLNMALQLGVIDHKSTLSQIKSADFVILAVPVDASLVLLPNVLDQIGENALVIDVGSTKFPICEAVNLHPKRHQFLATHPIAGTEFSGPAAAKVGLFEGKTNILCEIEKTTFKLQEKALELFAELGMRIRYMEPKSHDKHIAYVSHLSHISSFMLGKTVIEKEKDERDIFDMAGSGFESTVRLAKSSPQMWTPIFKQNKKHVLKSLDEYIANLSQFRELLEKDDYDSLFGEMQDTNRIKEILKGINKSKVEN